MNPEDVLRGEEPQHEPKLDDDVFDDLADLMGEVLIDKNLRSFILAQAEPWFPSAFKHCLQELLDTDSFAK